MRKTTDQTAIWSGNFGREYTERNALSCEEMDALYQKNFGTTRTEMNAEFVGEVHRRVRILEVGANSGTQLLSLQKMGFTNLSGIELQEHAVELARQQTKNIEIIQGTAFDIPFEDNSFDLVFTSGVLIHIAPADIKTALTEIHRCARRYIWGFEYFAEAYTPIEYRGNKNLLWKANFARLYLNAFNDLRLVKERRFKYTDSKNEDSMFLLEKDVHLHHVV